MIKLLELYQLNLLSVLRNKNQNLQSVKIITMYNINRYIQTLYQLQLNMKIHFKQFNNHQFLLKIQIFFQLKLLLFNMLFWLAKELLILIIWQKTNFFKAMTILVCKVGVGVLDGKALKAIANGKVRIKNYLMLHQYLMHLSA